MRIKKTVDDKTIHHVWDGSQQIIADVVDNEFYEANCYLRGTNLVATYNYQNGVKSGYTYYTQNAHGDVVNLTDETGVVTKSYTYDAFGVEQNIDNADDNAFRYCGEYYDKETVTIYLRARCYNPYNRRFVSRDSFASSNNDPLSLNLYLYFHNNHISGTDSTGYLMYAIYLQAIISIKIQPLKRAVLSGKQLGRTALSIFPKQHTIRRNARFCTLLFSFSCLFI